MSGKFRRKDESNSSLEVSGGKSVFSVPYGEL